MNLLNRLSDLALECCCQCRFMRGRLLNETFKQRNRFKDKMVAGKLDTMVWIKRYQWNHQSIYQSRSHC